MNMSTPPEGRGSLPPGDRNPRRHPLPAGAYAVLLPLAFVGFYLGLKKAFGDADMAGAQMLRLVVFIPAMAALMTGCLPLLVGLFAAQTWGRRFLRIFYVLLLLALTLPLAFCSLVFDIRFT